MIISYLHDHRHLSGSTRLLALLRKKPVEMDFTLGLLNAGGLFNAAKLNEKPSGSAAFNLPETTAGAIAGFVIDLLV